jgi:hypothetical protein
MVALTCRCSSSQSMWGGVAGGGGGFVLMWCSISSVVEYRKSSCFRLFGLVAEGSGAGVPAKEG